MVPNNAKVDIIPHDTWHALCRKEKRTFAGWGCGPDPSPNNIAGYKKCGRKAGRKKECQGSTVVVICETAFSLLCDSVPLLLSRPQNSLCEFKK